MSLLRRLPFLAGVLALGILAPPLDARLLVFPSSAPAKSDRRVVLIWEVGSEGMQPGGGFQVEFSSKGGKNNPFWKKNQTSDPSKAGYTRAGTDGAAEIDLIILEDAREVTVQVASGTLLAGQHLALEYNGYVPQIAMPFHWHVRQRPSGEGEWQVVPPEQSATFQVTAAEPETALAVIPSDVAVGEAFELAVVVTDRFLNRADSFRGSVTFASTDPQAKLPDTYRFKGSDRGVHVFSNVRFRTPGFHKITVSAVGDPSSVSTNYARVWQGDPPVRRFYGETHFHTGTGVENKGFDGKSGDHRGNYVREEDAFAFARDVMRLDFASAAEHDRPGMTDAGWERAQAIATSFNDPGRFTTFYGYEWTSGVKAEGGGQRVVVYDRPGQKLLRVTDAGSKNILDLWDSLDVQGTPALTIPHVQLNDPENTVFAHWHPHYQPIGEIHSKWNSVGSRDIQVFELGKDNVWTYQHAWAKGFRMGVIGSTDNHFGQPGLNNYTEYTGHHGGLAVVLASENTRPALWEGMQNRRVYATSGRRIYIDFLIKGRYPMGSELTHDPAAPAPTGEVWVAGTGPLETVEIVKYDGTRYWSLTIPDDDPDPELWHFKGRDYNFRGDSLYYVRVTQQDGEMAWSSPIWVDTPASGQILNSDEGLSPARER